MPVLVRHRRIVPQRCGALTCALHPRTAIGFSAGCSDAVEASECRLLVVIVDGRRPRWSIGVTTDRLARLMRRFGASEAVNLDGGASSQVIVDGTTRNRPAPGARRAVVSALIVRVPPAGGRNLP
jgi:exopolysaccharide biosynthesis protein